MPLTTPKARLLAGAIIKVSELIGWQKSIKDLISGMEELVAFLKKISTKKTATQLFFPVEQFIRAGGEEACDMEEALRNGQTDQSM